MSALEETTSSTRRHKPRQTAPQPTRAVRQQVPDTPGQHPLWLSTLLHLLPGAALSAFVVTLHSWGVDPLFALLLGIGLVITPLELGYLAVYAKRTTGSWSPINAVNYATRFTARQLLRLAILPALWMLVLVAISMGAVDEKLADSLFGWMPSAITDMATPDNDASMSGGTATALVIAFFVFNGLLGPITEELYFRARPGNPDVHALPLPLAMALPGDLPRLLAGDLDGVAQALALGQPHGAPDHQQRVHRDDGCCASPRRLTRWASMNHRGSPNIPGCSMFSTPRRR